MKNTLTKNTNSLQALVCSVIATLSTGVIAFAADNTLQGLIVNAINTIGSLVGSVFNPLCILAVGICIITLIFGRNSKSAEKSLTWGKNIVICFVVFNCLAVLTNFVLSLTGDSGFNWGQIASV